MAFANKTNGREYVNKSNSNLNKVQTMNYRNSLTNAQYGNSTNGESYTYEEKAQRSCNSPKEVIENHGVPQHNTSAREAYSYKGNNLRNKLYHQTKNYSDKHNNYYNQRPESPDEFLVPEIKHLREFISEQTERFKNELLRHENNKSNSPSPGGHQFDQSNYKYNKPQGNISRTGNGLTISHSLGSIANSGTNGQTVQALTVSPSCIDNSNRHPDARMNQGPLVVIKSNNNNYNYNKHYISNNCKPSPGLTRNLSHDETFSKPQSVVNNKNRNDSPINTIDKSVNNKPQFPSPTGSSGGRNDTKKAFFKTKPHTFTSGPNAMVHQNNLVPSIIGTNDVNKNDQQQGRPIISVTSRNGYSNGSAKVLNRRRTDNREGDGIHNYRAVVSVAETNARRVSHSGSSTTDSQEIGHSIVETPTVPEQFFTPDHSASPCSNRSSPETAFQYPRPQRKSGHVFNTRITSSNSHE